LTHVTSELNLILQQRIETVNISDLQQANLLKLIDLCTLKLTCCESHIEKNECNIRRFIGANEQLQESTVESLSLVDELSREELKLQLKQNLLRMANLTSIIRDKDLQIQELQLKYDEKDNSNKQ